VNSVEWWSMNYEQAFAIVGLGTSEEADIGSKPEATIAVEKVVWTREVAESEVSRLNRGVLNSPGVVHLADQRVETDLLGPLGHRVIKRANRMHHCRARSSPS
jgi:hypothetical protein